MHIGHSARRGELRLLTGRVFKSPASLSFSLNHFGPYPSTSTVQALFVYRCLPPTPTIPRMRIRADLVPFHALVRPQGPARLTLMQFVTGSLDTHRLPARASSNRRHSQTRSQEQTRNHSRRLGLTGVPRRNGSAHSNKLARLAGTN